MLTSNVGKQKNAELWIVQTWGGDREEEDAISLRKMAKILKASTAYVSLSITVMRYREWGLHTVRIEFEQARIEGSEVKSTKPCLVIRP